MRIKHKQKVRSKYSNRPLHRNLNSGSNNKRMSASPVDLVNGESLTAVATAITIAGPFFGAGYQKFKSYLRRHDSPLVTKCNFILTHPAGKLCGANAEILQIEYEGKETIIHRCTEFSAHIIPIADKRKISHLQRKGLYRK